VAAALGLPTAALGLFKIFFYFEALCTNQSSFCCPPQPTLPKPFQYHCTCIAQCTPPPPTRVLCSIHHTILVVAISCRVQGCLRPTLCWERQSLRGTKWRRALLSGESPLLQARSTHPRERVIAPLGRTKRRLDWYGGVLFLLQKRSTQPRERVITPLGFTRARQD